MDKYEAIKQLIEEHRDDLDLGEFGAGDRPLEIDIEKAQQRLNVTFPPSYLWWLVNYGGGAIMGDEIYSIYPSVGDGIPAGDIVYNNELNRKKGWSDVNQLIIQKNDMGETFYFDLLNPGDNGEYSVFRTNGTFNKKYAEDFLDFLKGRILDVY